MSARIRSTIPILPSLNIDESVAFYVNQLGFVQLAQLHDYAIVGRDGAEIHFNECNNPNIPANTSCYVRTGSTEALYTEFSGRGVKVNPPQVQPWGMKELHVTDPHGNLLKFGEQA